MKRGYAESQLCPDGAVPGHDTTCPCLLYTAQHHPAPEAQLGHVWSGWHARLQLSAGWLGCRSGWDQVALPYSPSFPKIGTPRTHAVEGLVFWFQLGAQYPSFTHCRRRSLARGSGCRASCRSHAQACALRSHTGPSALTLISTFILVRYIVGKAQFFGRLGVA